RRLRAREPRRTPPLSAIAAIGTPGARRVAVARGDVLELFSRDPAVASPLHAHGGQIYSIAWLPSPPDPSQRFLTGGADGVVRLWKFREADGVLRLRGESD